LYFRILDVNKKNGPRRTGEAKIVPAADRGAATQGRTSSALRREKNFFTAPNFQGILQE
jgi:hypothetical protein